MCIRDRGAYYAYVEFCEVRGFDAVPLEDFEKKEFEGYLGSFYSCLLYTSRITGAAAPLRAAYR